MRSYLFAVLILFISACNDSPAEAPVTQPTVKEEKPSFFPVTSYIKGQIYEIKEKGLSPIKYTTINEHTDSVFMKMDQLDSLLAEFVTPRIDSINLVPFFTESKFHDKTIDAFTFTYDPKGPLPDSIKLNHWDVYIDPETSKVKRIYITKKKDKNTLLQLTWQSGQWCKTVTIITAADGTSKVEKEEKISWDY